MRNFIKIIVTTMLVISSAQLAVAETAKEYCIYENQANGSYSILRAPSQDRQTHSFEELMETVNDASSAQTTIANAMKCINS